MQIATDWGHIVLARRTYGRHKLIEVSWTEDNVPSRAALADDDLRSAINRGYSDYMPAVVLRELGGSETRRWLENSNGKAGAADEQKVAVR